MRWLERLVCYIVVAASASAVTAVWVVEWERSTRLRCDPKVGEWRLIASYERRDEIACMYVTPTAVWGQKVKTDIKRRKGT